MQNGSPAAVHAAPASASALLQIRDLHTHFMSGKHTVHAVNGVNLTIGRGEIVGLVGESGCGKSALALSILRLIASPGKITSGSMDFDGRDILHMKRRDLTQFRRNDVGIIFQQPQSCLNPVRRIGWQVADPLVQSGMSRKQAWAAAVDLLRSVEIPAPEVRARGYAHQISGGQAQRVMIAIALARRPRLLIADEPTTALDVTIQAQILDLLKARCREYGTSLILVTHDLGVVARYADRVAVMYAGRIVEQAATAALLSAPHHPYTHGLLKAAPVIDTVAADASTQRPLHALARLQEIPGTLPDLRRPIVGCAFAPRCAVRTQRGLTQCLTDLPPSMFITAGRVAEGDAGSHEAACWAVRPYVAQSASDGIA